MARHTQSLLALGFTLCGMIQAVHAVQYDFLTCTPTGATTATFNSPGNGNGFITVTQTFSAGGAGAQNNNSAAIFPSTFTNLFPGTGLVQGQLTQTVYNHNSTVTFNFANYNLTQNTVFGIWNVTDEVTANPGTPFIYRVSVLDGGSATLAPTTWNFIGRQQNQTQVQGSHQLVLNQTNGDLILGSSLSGSTHTDAIFFDQLILGTGTTQITVTANLPPLNSIGDGVGYYFAEVHVPEPATAAALLLTTPIFRRRR